MAEPRSADLVRNEIAVERAELAEAVERARRQLAETTHVGSRISGRAGVLAPAAFVGGFVLSGGIGATMRYLARRSRER